MNQNCGHDLESKSVELRTERESRAVHQMGLSWSECISELAGDSPDTVAIKHPQPCQDSGKERGWAECISESAGDIPDPSAPTHHIALRAALDGLTQPDLLRFALMAKSRASGFADFDGDDLLQDALLAVLQGRRTWPQEAVDLQGFLKGAVRSISSNRRRRGTILSSMQPDDVDHRDPERIAHARQLIEKVVSVLRPHEDAYRTVHLMMFGLTGPEIADTLGFTKTRVASVMRFIRRKLSDAFPLVCSTSTPGIGNIDCRVRPKIGSHRCTACAGEVVAQIVDAEKRSWSCRKCGTSYGQCDLAELPAGLVGSLPWPDKGSTVKWVEWRDQEQFQIVATFSGDHWKFDDRCLMDLDSLYRECPQEERPRLRRKLHAILVGRGPGLSAETRGLMRQLSSILGGPVRVEASGAIVGGEVQFADKALFLK